MKKLLATMALLALAACGMKVNINGKTTTLGALTGSDEKAEPAKSADAPATAEAPKTGEKAADSAKPAETAAPAPRPETFVLEANLTDYPKVVTVPGVIVDGKFSKVIGGKGWPDCGSDLPKIPVVSFEIKEPLSDSTRISVVGGGNDGFILQNQDGHYWTACTGSIGQTPTMVKPKQGWVPGTYAIYPLSRYAGKGTRTYAVEFYDPEKKAEWSDKVRKISIEKKLDKPMFVEVTTRPGRVKLREAHSGYKCEKIPLAPEPDLAITLERPIPGLQVRPLFTKTPVTLRVQTPGTATKKARKFCSSWERRVAASNYAPSYESPVEFHFGKDDEGTYGLSFGTPEADEELKVTLMIFDASSQWEPLALFGSPGELPIEERILERYYPQLDVGELSKRRHENAQMAAELFGTAPLSLFVYSKLDLDKDIARLHSSMVGPDSFPRKNEPLLPITVGKERATVMSADGLQYTVKVTHILEAPDGAAAFPSSPRKLREDLSYGDAVAMAPESSQKHVKAYEAKVEKFNKCVDRVWAPYGKKIDNATYKVRSNEVGARTVSVETPRARKIRDQGQAAMDRTCGKEKKLDKDREAARKKILADLEKERVKRLAKAKNGRF